MSFSSDIKQELSKINNLNKKELVKGELLGYLLTNNTSISGSKVKYKTESEYNINRFHKLLSNLNIDYEIEIQNNTYIITFQKGNYFDYMIYKEKHIELMGKHIDCSKKHEEFLKSIIRGSFLGSGSINDPNKKYHLEIIFSSENNCICIQNILKYFKIKVKLLKRNNKYSIYIKDGEKISDLLALIGANIAVLRFEEIRVVRDIRNNINRKVNCETANLNKTIHASVRQIEEINLIKKKGKFKLLSDSLQEIANLRLENPDTSLEDLGKMLSKPISKSGVNNRFKVLSVIAEEE